MTRKGTGRHRLHIYLAEIYALVPVYFRDMYKDTKIVQSLVLFYIGFALLLAFYYFRLGHTAQAAIARINAIALIRLAITVNTMPVFVTVFVRARREEIAGMGRHQVAFEPASVYFAKFIALNVFRVLLFIPFTAITYPIIGFRGGFGHVMIFILTLAIQQMAAISIGLMIAAIFRDPNMAAVVTSTVVLVTFLFSGSILLRFATPSGLRWLEYLSISFYAHQALIHNELGGIRFSDSGTGKEFLEAQGLDIMGVWASLGALVLYTVICNIVGPFAFYLTSKP